MVHLPSPELRPREEASGARRPRIAFLATSLDAGGVERQMLLLARELRPSHDVRFFVMRSRGLFAHRPGELGLDVHALGWSNGSWRDGRVRYLAGLVRALITYRRLAREVDIVDAWLPAAYTFAGLAQPLVHGPALIAGRRVMSDNNTMRIGRFQRGAAALAMRRVSAVVANSEAVARDVIAVEGLRPSRVRVIRNGIDVPAPVRDWYRKEVRQQLGVRNQDLLVGCVANYKPGKGLEFVIAVAHRLRSAAPHLRFALVGEGPLREALEVRIAALGLRDVVTLHGAHPDAQRLYPGFDIVLHASESEGFPNAVLEAAAWGRPIVATDVGGTSEIVRHKREALLVPAGDEEGLAEAILELVRNPAFGQELARAARDRALAFSPRRLADETAQLYCDVLPTRRRRVLSSAQAAGDTKQPFV